MDQRVYVELVHTAYHDARFGAPFAMVAVLLFTYAIYPTFPARIVFPWMAFALACNILRLVTRWRYLRQPVANERTGRWSNAFVAVSAATGLSWGAAAWLFYTPQESSYRVLVVLVLAGMTTGASRLLAPILAASVSYFYLAIGPLMVRVLLYADAQSGVLAGMCVLYLTYMTIAAIQQVRTLRSTIRLGYENAALVESLGGAKEHAEKINRDLSAEIARREVTESELRATSERASAASQAKSAFLATMSHEIRTPMNGIIGMLRIVNETPLQPTQRKYIETAASSADTLLELLSDILDFSKIEAGRLELEHIAFSPAAVVRSVTDLLRPRARDKGLDLTLELDPRLAIGVLGDPTRLRQIMFNLIGNALKFTDHGRISVRIVSEAVEGHATTILFSVADTGIGIDPAAQQRIFSPFTQADSSMSRRFGGTGLGLGISQKLVEAMGSKIKVRSEIGQGSVFEFTVRFGRTEAPESPSNGSAQGGEFVPPRLQGRVLIVEDDRINQRVIGHFLKKMGLETGLAEDGRTAVKLALEGSWDAVLMDCHLPGLDGLEATRQIRAQRPDGLLPIIALTANVSTEDRTACLAAGMDDFLAKPVRVELLAATLQKRLRKAPPAPAVS